MEEMLQRVRNGEADPACELCGGIVKSDTISFGQSLIRGDRQGDEGERASRCVGGDWIDIECVSGGKLCAACEIEGAKVVIVNAEPTEMDDIADVVVRGSIGRFFLNYLLQVAIPDQISKI